MPECLSSPSEEKNYPLLLKAQDSKGASMTHWAKRSRDVIEEAYCEFQSHGSAVAILFRGLPISIATEHDLNAEWAIK